MEFNYGDFIYYRYWDIGDYGQDWCYGSDVYTKDSEYYFKDGCPAQILAVIPKVEFDKYRLVKEEDL